MKKSDFDIWSTQQFGDTPRPELVLLLIEKEMALEQELSVVRSKRRKYQAIGQSYTAALYARQAFEKKSR